MDLAQLTDWQHRFISATFATDQQASSPGMAIYRNNLVLTHRASIMATFPRACQFLGENTHIAVYRYLVTYGKSSYDWADCGAHFAEYLALQPELAHLPHIAAVAQYEWHRQLLNRAPAKPFNQASIGLLGTHAWTDLYLDLAPGWSLFTSEYDTHSWYNIPNNSAIPAKASTQHTWVCWRSAVKPQIAKVPMHTQVLYEHAAAMNIAQLAELAAIATPEPLDWMAWLATLMQDKQLFGLRSTAQT